MVSKRWLMGPARRGEVPAVDAFVADLLDVCRKHGMCIYPGDADGGLIVEERSLASDDKHLEGAAVGVSIVGHSGEISKNI